MIHNLSQQQADGEAFGSVQSYSAHIEQVRSSTLKAEWRYRIFDLFFIFVSAPVVILFLAAIALIVKLDDPRGPVLYYQTRYGKYGKPFRILKVRTMVPDADGSKIVLLTQSIDKGAGFKLDNDPRITRPGRVLRKLYLDELPQLWNVFRGDMAIVGPRANSTDPAVLEPWQRLRLSVRPGITGSWQTMRDKPRDFDERCRIDLEYIAQKSIRKDVGILFRTVHVMIVRPTGC